MIVGVARPRALAAGDSACGFGNTHALADTRHIPKVWRGGAGHAVPAAWWPTNAARWARARTAPMRRYLKAITGHPMAMEAEAACAHLSRWQHRQGHRDCGATSRCRTSSSWADGPDGVHGAAGLCTRLLNQAPRPAGTTLRDWLVAATWTRTPAYVLPRRVLKLRPIVPSPPLPAHRRRPGRTGGPAPGPCRKGVLAQQTEPTAGRLRPKRGPARDEGRFIEEMVAGRPGQSPLRPVRPRRVGQVGRCF